MLFITIPCTMFNLPASSWATFSKASRTFWKAHSVDFISTLKMCLDSSQSPSVNEKYQYFTLLWSAVCGLIITCSRYSLARDFRCPSCFSNSTSLRNFFAFALSSEKYSHIPRMDWSFPAFSILPIIQKCQAQCRQTLILTPSSSTIEGKLPKSEGFGLATIVTHNMDRCGNADRGRHETDAFCFIPAQVQ